MNSNPIIVVAFYKFVAFADCASLQGPLLDICQSGGLCGTILLAPEGINGTVAGPRAGIDAMLSHIRVLPGCGDINHKASFAVKPPFLRMKVRLKREIVTMGQPGIDPTREVGTYVAPADWNQLISDPDVVVIDTRNDYEMGIGSFKGAIKPDISTFSAFPEWFRAQEHFQGKNKIAIFCTGGIRCEKASAFLKAEGVAEVFHLQGGILKYLETMSEEASLWDGECFVFDHRVSVGHGLALGSHDLCSACKYPISADDKRSPLFEAGVSCPHCHAIKTPEQKTRFQERQKQFDTAKAKGLHHIGPKAGKPR